jgi:biofilm protein TabA
LAGWTRAKSRNIRLLAQKEGIEMILDVLGNTHRYRALSQGVAEAFDFLSRPDLKELPTGKYEIEGNRVYAIVAKDAGRRKEDALLEAHEKYIDIQLVLAGTDDMGWKSKLLCKEPSGTYDPKTDEQLFADKPDAWLSAKSGTFAIFFPEDAHMPLISSGQLHKIVVKVAVNP